MAPGNHLVLYHGSDHIVEKPAFHGGKRNNDYGYGFYTATDQELACEWAVRKNQDGFVNKYEMDPSGLAVLDLQDPSYNALNWLAILLENRTFPLKSPFAVEAAQYLKKCFLVPYRDADIIIGYRADDSYFRFAQDFLNGTISYQQLSRSLKLGELGIQIVICSRKATERLKFMGYYSASFIKWYPRKEEREKRARKDYYDMEKNRFRREDLYMIQIIDGEVTQDDPRL